MNIVTAIRHNTGTLPKFVTFLINNKYDYNKILSSEEHLENIFYYISYLESEQIYIIVDHNGYCVYKQFTPINQHVISCEFIDKPVLAKYLIGIVQAFNYLENPF